MTSYSLTIDSFDSACISGERVTLALFE